MTPEATAFADLVLWLRREGLEIVLWSTGSVLVARLVTWAAARWTTRIEHREPDTDNLVRSEDAKRNHALIQLLSWVAVVTIYVVAALMVAQRFGLSMSAIVPAATVAGVALGFGAQRIVQDLLAGFFLFAERQYGYGDLIRLQALGVGDPVIGTVEEVSLRTTTVRTPAGEVVITPNGQIIQTTNLSRGWARAVIDVPVPVTADVNHVNDILRDVGAAAYEDETLRPLLLDVPAVMGVESIEVDQFKVRVVARTLPGKQFVVGRTLRAMITRALMRENIRTSAQLATGEPTGTTQ
ncbi:mechanosensitive ion channel family protein [Nocardioides daphniae]|uniref:Mechanosensitive ion channel family protein n=1 Tax=Nocardioides daphniae TaxID=402297 RepID=A0A4P7U9B6_9ACTN|nr:mechanosensitive ion channel family protein [Nocardioides daphniae]QCC76733.1 mechanosensitive ion channel family protein [Nocardioides daphniae]GGD15801.1 mechanosensitive ion channel protein MscS [Nocardioides daphniae]